MTDTPLRTFLAVLVSAEVREACNQLRSRLRQTDANVKWVPPGQIHITLKFFGDLLPAEIERIQKALAEPVAAHPAFTLGISSPGAFPGWRRPKVFWVGLAAEGLAELSALQATVMSVLAHAGFPGETRPFRPHLTIGRVRRDAQPHAATAVLRAYDLPPIRFPVTRLSLMKSNLTRQGAEYTVLSHLPLKT